MSGQSAKSIRVKVEWRAPAVEAAATAGDGGAELSLLQESETARRIVTEIVTAMQRTLRRRSAEASLATR